MREPWTDVTDDEIRAFLGLCILAGVYKSIINLFHIFGQNRKADWFLQQPAIYTDILKYIRFDDKATQELRVDRQQTSWHLSET